MGEDPKFRAAKPGGIHDAGMDQLIQDDDIVRAEQRADGAGGSRVAGGEAERGGGPFEAGDGFVEFVVGSQ